MSYIGVRVNPSYGLVSHNVTIRVHGPLDTFVLNPVDLKTFALRVINSCVTDEATFNMANVANKLSHEVTEKFCDGNNLLWTEVEIVSPTSIIYCSSAEKVSS